MRPFVIFGLFLILACTALGQSAPDSLAQELNQVMDRLPLDTLEKTNQALQLPDSLKRPFQQADSLRTSFIEQSAKLKNEHDAAIGKIDAESEKVRNAIDSLENLQLPASGLTEKLDSLQQVREGTRRKFTERSDKLKAATTDKLKKLDLPPQYQEPVQQLTSSVDGFSLDGDMPAIGELKLPGYDLPKFEGLGDVSLNGNAPDLGSLPAVETPVGDLGNIGEQVKGYQGDLKNIADGNLTDVKQLPKTIEEQAGKLDEIAELQKQSGAIDGMQSKVEGLSDAESAKQEAAAMAKKAAVDHFAGKEEQLKAAMDKLAKYKKKYSSVSSIKDLPRRAPNAMKGKPFRERFIPGFYFQYQQRNDRLFDFNPYGSYRLSGRFTVGLGWNERFAYDRITDDWDKKERIFGPRTFVDFKLGRGFIAHLEGECMNSFVPFSIAGSRDHGQREWVWGSMLGLKKEYKVYKNLKGTVLLQYNLFDRNHRAPYVDRLNSRIGFEYSLKKQRRKDKAL